MKVRVVVVVVLRVMVRLVGMVVVIDFELLAVIPFRIQIWILEQYIRRAVLELYKISFDDNNFHLLHL